MQRLNRLAIGILIAAFIGVANAQPSGELRIVSPPRATDFSPLSVGVVGNWLEGCPPQLDRVNREGSALRLYVTTGQPPCDDVSSRFSFAHQIDASELATINEALRVTVLQAGDDGTLVPLAFAVLPTSRKVTKPESGIWWPEPGGRYETSGPGIGFSVETLSSWGAVFANLYDTEGRADWWFGTGQLRHSVFAGEIANLSGGQMPFAPYTMAQPGRDRIRLFIEFQTPARGVAWLVGRLAANQPLQIWPVSITRFTFGGVENLLIGGWIVLRQNALDYQGTTIRWIDARAQSTNGQFVVTASDGQYLECRYREVRTDSPPDRCEWFDAGGERLGFFEDFGTDFVQGVSEDGQRLLMIREPRF